MMRVNIPGYLMLYAIDLLTTRRSIKPVEMTGPGPSPAELETILTIGARVPDHGKIVPWRPLSRMTLCARSSICLTLH